MFVLIIFFLAKNLKILAAFIEPPPKPALFGIFLFILILNFLSFSSFFSSKILSNFVTVLFLPIFCENLPQNKILCDLDFIFLIKISSCNETKATILSILCNDEVLPTIFKAKFNLAYDLILI